MVAGLSWVAEAADEDGVDVEVATVVVVDEVERAHGQSSAFQGKVRWGVQLRVINVRRWGVADVSG